MSKVVADTGEIDAIKNYKPHDVTTNPSLVLKAVQNPKYQHLLGEALAMDDHSYPAVRPQSNVADILAVNIGADLLKIIPGRVSTECDAHLSYDTKATIEKGLRIVDLYAKKGVDTSRLYIKIASTWEGIRACEELQKQGIQTNMTLLFSFGQAAACADAGAALISPFVGRIMDWYKAKEGRSFEPHEDPGVLSVRRIYKYYKQYKYPTIVMAASFRNVGEIRELAGCDNITISPALLGELEASTEALPRKLWPEMGGCDEPKIDMGADSVELFKKLHGEDEMAVQKLAEGIQGFSKDQASLEAMVEKLISS
ncbi:g186 [Coccomyxa elongata]